MTLAAFFSALVLPCWALASLAFGLLALDQSRGHAPSGRVRRGRRGFVLACALTSLWALAMAGMEAGELATRLAEGLRSLAWLGFMAVLALRDGGDEGERRTGGRARVAVGAVYAAVAGVGAANLGLVLLLAALPAPALAGPLGEVRLVLRMMAAIGALVLTHQLQAASSGGRRRGLGLLVGALAAMWGCDLVAYAAAWWLGGWAPALVVVRGGAALLIAPMLGVAAHRGGEWEFTASRALAWQSLRALAVVAGVAAVVVGTALTGALAGPHHARVAQTAFVLGTATAALTLLSNPWLRAWARVMVAKHLFRHRYDYRAEWVRFTDTLAKAGMDAPLERRVVKAIADLVYAPAGLLLVPDGDGLGEGPGWNWDGAVGPPGSCDAALAAHLCATGRIVEIDAVRAGAGNAEDTAALPPWLLAHADAWAVVPLLHLGRLAGAVVLARPPGERALDWEDLDLLRICGRQAASHLAEARAQGLLAEARRFDEFSRRFAFIVHDVKNLASQVALVARNAERHADNPAFRADMVATLRDSSERMNALLARLSQQRALPAEPPGPVALLPLAEQVARGRRAQHPVVALGDPGAWVLADAGRLRRLLDHLVQNAIEASARDAAVALVVRREGDEAVIEVVDRGCGMSPAFVRDELFRAFSSSKPTGFGIGAFEARQLAEAMGGRVEVASREGEGTRFAVRLPAHVPAVPALEAA